MSTPFIPLPLPLILLVHLHILDYPHANKQEYDHDLFNPRLRGLRDRTKSMEDIFYFLVGRLEGGKNGAKSILATYPCMQPSEILAFRTSLYKYLEVLRHQSLYPSVKVALNGSRGKDLAGVKGPDRGKPSAWWWKDVVVRKSLLEECAGEKFERLLLSVSTHVLHRCSSTVHPDTITAVLHTQPGLYASLLNSCQSHQHSWSRKASMLLQRKSDLQLLRDHLTTQSLSRQSRYEGIPLDKLVALVESMHRDLLAGPWSGTSGQRALQFLIELAGLSSCNTDKLNPSASNGKQFADSATNVSTVNNRAVPAQPLPVAAAHHPSHLRRLRRPVFQSIKDAKPTVSNSSTKNLQEGHAQIILSELLVSEKRMAATLTETLSRTRCRSGNLKLSLVAVVPTCGSKEVPGREVDLWNPPSAQTIFEPDRTTDDSFLAFFGLSDPASEEFLDTRIDHIREVLLPSYPSIPDLSEPRLQPEDSDFMPTRPSRIPVASSSAQRVPSSLSTPPRGLMTSTPPATLKPPSEYTKSTKKSSRFSVARMKRPSMFIFKDEEYNEVDQIVHGTEDTSTELSPTQLTPMSFKTPKKRPPINRIWTSGSAKPKSTVKKARETPRESFPIEPSLLKPAVSLPSFMLASSSSSFGEVVNSGLTDDEERDYDPANQGEDSSWGDAAVSVTPTLVKKTLPSPGHRHESLVDGIGGIDDDESDVLLGDGDRDELEEGHSMTLRDILLQADTSHFDLLKETDGMLQSDESIIWE